MERKFNLAMLEKRGISPLVATVIIIAITVAAGITLYALVWPLINKPILATQCTDVNFDLDKDSSCVSINTNTPLNGYNKLEISIDRTRSRSDEPKVIGWKITVDAAFGEKRTFNSPPSDPAAALLLSPPQLAWPEISAGQQRTYLYNITATTAGELKGNVTTLSVFPLIEIRRAAVECEQIQRRIDKLKACIA